MDINDYIKKTKKEGLDSYFEVKKREMQDHNLMTLFLEVTLRCNARCDHCGSRCENKKRSDEVTAQQLKDTLKEISEAYDPSNIMLNVTGGEPLVRKDIFEILEYADKLGFPWGMTTNGMLINDKVIEQFEKTNLRSISISIDGMQETHDSFRHVTNGFNRIIEAIKKLKKLKEKGILQTLQVTTVANKKNLNELEDLYNLMNELELDSWRLVTVDPIGRASDNKDILLEPKEFQYVLKFIREKNKLNKVPITYGCSHYLGMRYENSIRYGYFNCNTGINVGSILANGDIFVCPNVPKIKELIQGNIKNDSFVDVWENKYKEFRHLDRLKTEKCNKCEYYKYCLGDSFHTFDYINKVQNICAIDMLTKDILDNAK